MAKKYTNFRIGGSPQKLTDDYTVWSNDLLQRIIASKTVIQPGKSTIGHKLIDSDVVYIITNGRGTMEIVEYMNSDEGHGSNPSYGIEHKDSYELSAGDVVLVESGDYCKVVNDSDHDQLTYLRIFDSCSIFTYIFLWGFIIYYRKRTYTLYDFTINYTDQYSCINTRIQES